MNGTITKKKLSNGRPSWGYVFDGGKGPDGKRVQVTKSGFETKGQASEQLRQAIADFEAKCNAAPPATIPTFAEFFARWMEEHAARRCTPKTLEAYGQHGAYAIREFGSVPIDKLTTEMLETALNRLQDRGGKSGRPLAPKTIRHIFFVVSGALKKARKWGLVTRNVMEDVDRPQKEAAAKKKPLVLDNAKMKRFLDSAANSRLYPLLVLAAATGCRRGELLALEWSDLDTTMGTLLVTKSIEETRNGLRVKSTKSGEPRDFSVPAVALSVLEQHRVQQDLDRAMYGEAYEEHHLIFCRPDGAYYRPDQMSVRVTNFARKNGFPGVGLHSLRHSHASQLLSDGTPITAVSDRLGHANSSVTLSIYSHVLPADKSAAAEVWNTAMANVVQTERKLRPARMLENVSGKNTKPLQLVEKKAG